MSTTAHRIKCQSRLASQLRRRTVLNDNDGSYLNEKAAYFLLMLPEEVALYAGMVYQGHVLRRREEGWLLVVNASQGGVAKVTFYHADTHATAVRNFAWDLVNHRVQWKIDKFKVK